MFLEDRGWRETLNRMPRWFSRIDNIISTILQSFMIASGIFKPERSRWTPQTWSTGVME
jgi:hypothetical protein